MQLMECPGDECTYFQEFGFCCDGCIRNGYYHDKLNFGIVKHKNIEEMADFIFNVATSNRKPLNKEQVLEWLKSSTKEN